jgi:histidine ammonia-lyase
MNQIFSKLTQKEFIEIVLNNSQIELTKENLNKINSNHSFLESFSQDSIIYGVNTGFGPMAQYRVSEENKIQLQLNLIRSHASGSGNLIPIKHIRGAMLARLNSLLKCKSGVHISVVETLSSLINKEVYPVVFEHGGVGASGDLVQLAHIALVLIGEGEVIYKGERRKTIEVFEIENIKPIKITIREGLALMNGTSLMTGIGLINCHNAEILAEWILKCSSIINEIVSAYDDHYSAELNEVKLHKGQNLVAQKMREHLIDSKLTKKRADHLYTGKVNESFFKDKVQEYYSIRCIPQILGPIFDTICNVSEVLENELNSANDNPIIDSERQEIYHGGNFHGDYVSLEMDKLRLVVTKATMLSERQLNFLLNNKLNNVLPPFINRGVLGLNYGIQGAQFTATSTTAENQMLSNSMYVHSIPCNNDNQDIVSMGTNAAQLTNKVISNSFEVLSIEIIAIVQSVRYLEIYEDLSSESKQIMDEFKTLIPEIILDQPLYSTIENVKNYLLKN